MKDELAKRQSELENRMAYGDNTSDYTHNEVNQHQGGIITLVMIEGLSMQIITKGIGDKEFHIMGNSLLDKWSIQTMVRII